MSTRAVVAIPMDNGFRGRYVHSDGYPTHMGRALHAIVKRDGAEQARKVLIENHHEWYVLFPDRTEDELREFTYGDMHAVPGYGVRYDDLADCDDCWWDSRDDDGDLEWAYVLNDTAVSVLHRADRFTNPRWVHVGDLTYGLDYDREQLTKVECGERFERCTHMAWYHIDSLDRNDSRSMRVFLAEQPV